MTPSQPRKFDLREDLKRLAPFLVFSFLLHFLLLQRIPWEAAQPETSAARPEMTVRVQPVRERRQVVDAPAVSNRSRPEEAFLGKRDQRVEEETIARELGRARNAQASEGKQSRQESNRPQRGTKLSEFIPDPYPQAEAGADMSRQRNAVDRSLSSVTLLNTKSHPYSEYLIDRGYRAVRLLGLNAELTTWFPGDVRDLRLPAMVGVAIDADGRVLDDWVESSSGSPKVDRMLKNALRGAVRGSVPPREAMAQGRLTVLLALETDVLRIGIR